MSSILYHQSKQYQLVIVMIDKQVSEVFMCKHSFYNTGIKSYRVTARALGNIRTRLNI